MLVYTEHPIFKVAIPTDRCPNVPSEILNPENTWTDKNEYKLKASELASKFTMNFSKFKDVPENIIKAGPNLDNIKPVGDAECLVCC